MEVANLIVFDLETGGLKAEECAITEIAMIAFDTDTLEEIDRYESVIAPYSHPDGSEVRYEPTALSYSGMTMAKIRAGKPAKEVAIEVQEFLKKHKKKMRRNGHPILAGHNIDDFDIPFLSYFLWIHGCMKRETTSSGLVRYKKDLFQTWNFDSLWWTRMKFAKDGSIVNHKLGTVAEKLGLPLVDAHRAMNDVEGNAEVIKSFIRSLRGDGGSEGPKMERPRNTFRF